MILLKRFFEFIKPYRVIAILAPLLKLLEATLELFVPLIMAMIIDKGISLNDTRFILIMGAVLVGIAILGLCVSITSQYFSAKTATGFAADISGELFRHISKLSKKDYESIGTTSLVTRISSDVNQVQTGLNLALRLLLRSPFIVFGAMIMAFTVSASMAVIFVVIIPVLAVIVTAVLKLSVKSYKNVQKDLESVVRRSSENIAGIRPIRAFGAQKNEVDQFEKEVNDLKKSQMKNAALQSFLTPATFVVVNVGIIALIYGGAIKVDIGELSRGEVVALVNYMSQILVELVKLANLVISINKAITCFGRINEVLELPTIDSDSADDKNASTDNDDNNKQNSDKKMSDQDGDDSCVLRFDNVSFTYPDSNEPTLKNISFELKKGEKLGIIGGTGSGKSTVIKLITGEYPVSEGTIISGVTKQEIGVSAQKAVLFSGTVKDNVLMGRNAEKTEINNALKIAKAYEFVSEKGGLDSEVEPRGKNFSGGQRQRLCIARALLKNPKLFVLDDSFSALDTVTENELRKDIEKNFPSSAGIIISQRIHSIMDADRIMVLENGEVVGYGTHKCLMKESDIYRDIARIGGVAE